MKFEYDVKNDDRECVAFEWLGHIHIKLDCGNTVLLAEDFSHNPGFHFMGKEVWDHRINEATHKFYPGDKLTITF